MGDGRVAFITGMAYSQNFLSGTSSVEIEELRFKLRFRFLARSGDVWVTAHGVWRNRTSGSNQLIAHNGRYIRRFLQANYPVR